MRRVTGIGGIFISAKDPKSTFMVNYRVDDLAALLKALRDEGCNVLEKTDDSDYGKFGWVMDPEGNKVELWQPPPGQ
jgi:predicted enzyme related to lactoylglutathione lyase